MSAERDGPGAQNVFSAHLEIKRALSGNSKNKVVRLFVFALFLDRIHLTCRQLTHYGQNIERFPWIALCPKLSAPIACSSLTFRSQNWKIYHFLVSGRAKIPVRNLYRWRASFSFRNTALTPVSVRKQKLKIPLLSRNHSIEKGDLVHVIRRMATSIPNSIGAGGKGGNSTSQPAY